MGRKKLPVVPKAKKIKLNKVQKQYAKMIRSIEADLEKKKAAAESLKAKLAVMQETLRKLEAETSNLESAKKNLEGVLSQIPPPPQWMQFTKYVYECHHYHHHCDTGCGPSCPWHRPIYIGPWWHYYPVNGGSYLTYPTYSQLVGVGTIMTTTGNASIGDIPNNGYALGFQDAKLSEPGGVVSSYVYNNSVSVPLAQGQPPFVGGLTMTNTSSTGTDAMESMTALQNIGFFDAGMPPVPKSGSIQIS